MKRPSFKRATKQIRQQLIRARKLLAFGWCQRYLGKYSNGSPAYETELSKADQWCARGAIMLACGVTSQHAKEVGAAEQLLKKANGIEYVVEWNNATEQTQAGILAGFDKAIKLAK